MVPNVVMGFCYFICCCIVQSNSELLSNFLHHISNHRPDHNVQYRPHLWWAFNNGVWMAHSGNVDPDCGSIYGRGLLCFSNFWWALLLECQALWQRLGPFCFLDHWLVRFVSYPFVQLYFVSHVVMVLNSQLQKTIVHFSFLLFLS